MSRLVRCHWVLLLVLPSLLGAGESARAQAWLPAKGTGAINAAYVYYHGGDHLFSTDSIDGQSTRGYVADGNRWYLGDTYANTFLLRVDYGLFSNVAVSASAPYVTSKYVGRAPVDPAVDNGQYHGSFQDARIQVRFQLDDYPWFVAPAVAVVFPIQEYNTSGHSAIGRRAKELQFGLSMGRSLAPWMRNAYIHASGLWGLPEAIDGVAVRRASYGLELGYFWKQITFSAFGAFDNTNGGLDWISTDPSEPCGHCGGGTNLYNRVAAIRVARLGTGIGLGLLWDVSVQVSYMMTMWGENLEDSQLLSFGMSYAFSTPFVEK